MPKNHLIFNEEELFVIIFAINREENLAKSVSLLHTPAETPSQLTTTSQTEPRCKLPIYRVSN